MRSIPFDNFRSLAALTRYALVAAIGLGLDLWTKFLAQRHLQDSDGIQFIPGWLHVEYTRNHGAVFGIGQGQRALFLVVSAGAIVFLTYLFATSARQRIYQFTLGLLLAGVRGNLYDRIVFGYVRDMIHVLPRWGIFPWVFNIADSLLCVGVFLMILHSLLYRKEDRANAQGFPATLR